MGAYRYCKCGAAHDKPTAEEDLGNNFTGDVYKCRSCGKDMPRDWTVEQWIADVDTRLRALEERFPPDDRR